jgi:hypothetical protein
LEQVVLEVVQQTVPMVQTLFSPQLHQLEVAEAEALVVRLQQILVAMVALVAVKDMTVVLGLALEQQIKDTQAELGVLRA